MKRFSIVVIAMLLVVAMAVPTFANPFTDVPAHHWAYEAINKLVAAGIVEGYPDGTYKGQNKMTRYEIAVIVGRVLDNLAAERDYLAGEIAAGKEGLTTAQAQDVTAIVKVLMEKNKPTEVKVPKNLTEQQVDEVVNLIEALTFEYKAELKLMGKDVDAIIADVDALEARVAALENAEPVVSFSGSYSVDMIHQEVEGKGIVDDDLDYYWFDTPDGKVKEEDLNDKSKGIAVNKDRYVYTDPWDSDSDKIDDLDEDKDIEQTLDFTTHLNKDDFKAAINIDVAEDDDEFEIDSASLTMENDKFVASYNEKNKVALKDNIFNDEKINGLDVSFKNLALDVFFGDKDVAIGKKEAKATKEFDIEKNGYKVTGEKKVVKYKWDAKKKKFVAKTKDDKKKYYVYGAKKSFALDNIDLNASFAGRRAKEYTEKDKEAREKKEVNVFALDAATDLAGLALNMDLAYSMPEVGDSDTLIRFGAKKDLDVLGLEFNYKNIGEDYKLLYEDAVLTDSDEDDYDKYTTAINPGLHGYNFTVSPKIIDNLDASVFYANVTEKDDKENTKLALEGEMPFFIDGLTINGRYETTEEDKDEEKTTGFGAEYKFLAEKATATFDYKIADPVENETPKSGYKADKDEKTMKLGMEYAFTDYITANMSYKNVTNLGHLDKFAAKDMTKKTTGFGVELADYPIILNGLTLNAGIDYENAEGDGYDYDDEAEDIAKAVKLESQEEKTTKYNLGFSYTIGAAELGYDYAHTEKEGDAVGGPGEGGYDTHKFDLTYNIIGDTDFVASYEVLDLDINEGDDEDYKIKTAKAGISIDF